MRVGVEEGPPTCVCVWRRKSRGVRAWWASCRGREGGRAAMKGGSEHRTKIKKKKREYKNQ